MTSQKYPPGWSEDRVRRVLAHYESQSDEAAAAEIETGLKHTTMEVPVRLVPAIRQLIAKRGATRTRKTATSKVSVRSRRARA